MGNFSILTSKEIKTMMVLLGVVTEESSIATVSYEISKISELPQLKSTNYI